MALTSSTSIPQETWDRFVAGEHSHHILQTTAWGTLKSHFGWSPQRVGLLREGQMVGGAQVLYRRLPVGLGTVAYVPKGPMVDWTDESAVVALLQAMGAAAQSRGAIALTVEPDLIDDPARRQGLRELDFRPAPFSSVQPRRTLIVDIQPEEDDILAAMKSKTRYNVRLASRRGVTVRPGTEADLPAFQALMATTAERDEFGVHAPAYYERAFHLFVPHNRARLLLAEVEGKPVAALMVFALPPRSWYFYGASSNQHREKMPTYLLQWEAIRWAKSLGCTSYDLWGVPDRSFDELEEAFTQRGDGLWGVYRFKRGFGGRLVRSVGAWDLVYAPVRYRLYRKILDARNRLRQVGS